MRSNVLLLGAAIFVTCVAASPVWNPQFLSGGSGRNIRHLPCVSRRTGETGICMFAFACMKANGTHLGTCIDRFYFGSCCRIGDANTDLGDLDHNTIFGSNNSEDNHIPIVPPSSPITTTTESKYYLSTFQSVQDNTIDVQDNKSPIPTTTSRSPTTTSRSTVTTPQSTTTTTSTRPVTTTTRRTITSPSTTPKTTTRPTTVTTSRSTPTTTRSTTPTTTTKRTTTTPRSTPPSTTTWPTRYPTSTASTTKSTTKKPTPTRKPTTTTTKKPTRKPVVPSTTKKPVTSTKKPVLTTTTTTPTVTTTTTQKPVTSAKTTTPKTTTVTTKPPSTTSPTPKTTTTTTTRKPSKPTTTKPTPKPPPSKPPSKPTPSTTKPTTTPKPWPTKVPATTKQPPPKTTTTTSTTTTAPASLVTWTLVEEHHPTIETAEATSTEAITGTTESWVLVPVTTHPPTGGSTDAPQSIGTTEVTTTSEVAPPGLTTLTPELQLNMTDYKQVCGRRLFPESRIVGGEKASFGKWPWQISLRQWRTSTYLHKCGAALLNENWAITAAHCVENVPPSDLLLRLGEHDLSTEEEPYGYQERRVQIVASHPQFDPRTFEYDLALLRFYEPVTFQPNILPVCVPEDDTNFVGQTAFVTGWGRLYEDGPLPSVLQEVSVPVINNSVCETMYRSAGYIEHIPEIFICAGWRKGGFDSCEGDSGGPMVIQRPDKRWLLAGVISWGIGCAEPNQPGVYTRISEFREWINQILQF